MAALAATAWSAMRLGVEFMPSLDEGTLFYMPVTLPASRWPSRPSCCRPITRSKSRSPRSPRCLGKAGRAVTATDPAPRHPMCRGEPCLHAHRSPWRCHGGCRRAGAAQDDGHGDRRRPTAHPVERGHRFGDHAAHRCADARQDGEFDAAYLARESRNLWIGEVMATNRHVQIDSQYRSPIRSAICGGAADPHRALLRRFCRTLMSFGHSLLI